VRTTTSRYGLYELGYTRATMVLTKRCKNASFSYSSKRNRSSDYSLQFENMKLELLVIVYQHGTVNSEPGLVHTARHAMEAGFVLHI